MIRVVLPWHLRVSARVEGEVLLEPPETASLGAVLDALEARHPVLRGTVSDPASRRRRPLIRYFACRRDDSHVPPDTPLPDDVVTGRAPLLVVGAVAGG
jgi:sulfur-carrier protein